ncbi:hypothetical protein IK112_02215 [Candidatus Saccharibacteria bacterium]|nr:hypothetical protein [Candidatus Saccharibacteria bacterium]
MFRQQTVRKVFVKGEASPISPLSVGIRFRMYSQATTTGAMVTCTTRTSPGTGGLPRLTVVVTRTT